MSNKLFLVFFIFISGCSASTDVSDEIPIVDKSLDVQYLFDDFKMLSSDQFQGRKTGSEGSKFTQQFLIAQLKQHSVLPFNNSYVHSFEIPKKSLTGRNIIGFVPGANNTGKAIVISAHYDHLGQASQNRIYNGADDNASGTSAVLSLAKQIIKEPLKHDVIFLFTDAEELNLLGAKAFLNEIGSDKDNILLNINLDMLAGSNKQRNLYTINKYLPSVLNSKYIHQLKYLQRSFNPSVLYGLNRTERGTLNKRSSWAKASDHGVFALYKIPYIYFGVGTHENYHTTEDNFENANTTLFLSNVQHIYQQLIFIDRNSL